MKTVVAFDVSCDGQRSRIARRLLGEGERVQKSIFEIPHLKRAAYLRLRSDLEGLFDPRTDALRYYRLCANCVPRTDFAGIGPGLIELPPPFEFID